MRFLIFALIAVLLIPAAHAQCTDPAIGNYPGWQERFSGFINDGATAKADNFNVTVEKIFGATAVRVNVLRDGSDYFRDSVSTGSDGALKKSDVIIELNSANTTAANLSVYTPQRANLSANLTNIDLLNVDDGTIKLLPGEVFQITIELNNTGELGALDIQPSTLFGDFQIRDTDAGYMGYLCPGSTRELKYTLITPNLREAFNYTLYIKFDYRYQNIQTGETKTRSTFHSFDVEVSPAMLEVSRTSSNWSLKNPGRDVTIRVLLNNSGNEAAYNVQWAADLPPYVQVKSGTTSYSGNIAEGKTKTLSYVLVSDDPIICSGFSKVTYSDRYGNDYTASSQNDTFRFSPFVAVEKTFDSYSEYFDPMKTIFQGNVSRELTDTEWFAEGGEDESISGGSEITINRTRNITVKVKVKNLGNAVARGLIVNDSANGSILNGNTGWLGDLHPDEEVSYGYTMDSFDRREIDFLTNVSYQDVDPLSFIPPEEGLAGSPQVRFCTVTQKKVRFGNTDTLYVLVPEIDLNLSVPKVLSGSEFNFNVNLTSNGSDTVHDVVINVDTKSLGEGVEFGGEILEGQTVYYLPELKAKFFPDGTERNDTPTNQSYNLLLRAPQVDLRKDFNITVSANYTDFYGIVHTRSKSINITVLPAAPAYAVATISSKNLTVTSGSPGEIELDGYGDAFIRIKNIGYLDLENITLRIKVPPGLELYSNDTAFQGRIVAELKRNDTWYGFEGEVDWNGSLASGVEEDLPFIIRGKKSGAYDINATLKFDSNSSINGSISLVVQGAILQISKSINNPLITTDESTVVVVTVVNVGKSTAKFVKIVDHVPDEFDIIGETETDIEELKSGEQVTLKYNIVPKEPGSYTIQRTDLEWADELGNQYELRSNALAMEVVATGKAPTEVPVEDKRTGLSRRQILVTALFGVVFLVVMFKFLTLTRPVKEE